MPEERNGRLARVIGVILILILVFAGVRYLGRRRNQSAALPTPPATSAVKSEEDKIEEQTKLTVPQEGDKVTLRNVSGSEGVAIANRVKKDSGYEVTVTANLPDPDIASHYEAWLLKDDESVLLGRLTLVKAGYILEKQVSFDAAAYGRVVVSEERVEDQVMEKKVLEGNF